MIIGIGIVRRGFVAAFDETLRARALGVVSIIDYSDVEPHIVIEPKLLPNTVDPGHPDLFEVWDARGSLVTASPDWKPQPDSVRPSSDQIVNFRKDGIPYRAIVLRDQIVPGEQEGEGVPVKVTILYASSTAEMASRLSRLALYIAAASLLFFVLASAAAAVILRRGLRPLGYLATQASRISASQWDFVPDPRGSRITELQPLIGALENLLARLHQSFDRQREFISDAAHELKTSVAILKSSLQLLMYQKKTEDEYRAGLTGLLEDTMRLEGLLERMLRLERIEQLKAENQNASFEMCDLTQTCETAALRVAALAEAKNIQVALHAPESFQVRGVFEDLELLWVNLLENAIRHSPNGSTVFLALLRRGSDSAVVTVEDSGEGIPEEFLSRIFDRFFRADPSRSRETGGSGLGLAICRAIAEEHHATIQVMSQLGRFTRFEVVFYRDGILSPKAPD